MRQDTLTALESAAVTTDESILDDHAGHQRPDDCSCLPSFDDLPCWPCYREGFETPNPDATEDDQ